MKKKTKKIVIIFFSYNPLERTFRVRNAKDAEKLRLFLVIFQP